MVRYGQFEFGLEGLEKFWNSPFDYTVEMWRYFRDENKKDKQENSLPVAKLHNTIYQDIKSKSKENNKLKDLDLDEFALYKFKEFEDYIDYSEDLKDIVFELREEEIIPKWLEDALFLHEKLTNLFVREDD